MRVLWVLVSVVLAAAFARGGAPVPTHVACAKNVCFAVAEGGQPVPAIPKFVVKWLGNKMHLANLPGLCFSRILSSATTNYIVIFSTSEMMFEGLILPFAHTYTSAKTPVANAAAVNSYGGTWNYSYLGTPPANATATLDLQREDKPKSLYVRAYNQRGGIVSRNNLETFHSREKLLEGVLTDLRCESPGPPKQKPFAFPLSVYYINCDVDGPPVAQTAVDPSLNLSLSQPTRKEPDPETALDVWSNPAGAEIYLDGAYIGKTPYSRKVPPGEHWIVIQKIDFGTWQRKLVLSTGTHRITAHLEQKTLNLE